MLIESDDDVSVFGHDELLQPPTFLQEEIVLPPVVPMSDELFSVPTLPVIVDADDDLIWLPHVSSDEETGATILHAIATGAGML